MRRLLLPMLPMLPMLLLLLLTAPVRASIDATGIIPCLGYVTTGKPDEQWPARTITNVNAIAKPITVRYSWHTAPKQYLRVVDVYNDLYARWESMYSAKQCRNARLMARVLSGCGGAFHWNALPPEKVHAVVHPIVDNLDGITKDGWTDYTLTFDRLCAPSSTELQYVLTDGVNAIKYRIDELKTEKMANANRHAALLAELAEVKKQLHDFNGNVGVLAQRVSLQGVTSGSQCLCKA